VVVGRFLVAFCCFAGCERGPAAEQGLATADTVRVLGSGSNRVAPAPSGSLAIAEDRSLTLAEYAAQGMPTSDRTWSATDYNRALALLEATAANDPRQLPRWGSPRSGALFARLSDPANFQSEPNASATPPAIRLDNLAPFIAPIKKLAMLYGIQASRGPAFDYETARMLCLMVRLGAEALVLNDRARSAMSASERESRKAAFAKIADGAAGMFAAALVQVAERTGLRNEALLLIVDTLADTLPATLQLLPPEFAKELPARVKAMVDVESDAALKAALGRLGAALERARRSVPADRGPPL